MNVLRFGRRRPANAELEPEELWRIFGIQDPPEEKHLLLAVESGKYRTRSEAAAGWIAARQVLVGQGFDSPNCNLQWMTDFSFDMANTKYKIDQLYSPHRFFLDVLLSPLAWMLGVLLLIKAMTWLANH